MVERYAHVAPEGLQMAAGRLDSFIQTCHSSAEWNQAQITLK
jgi:hypothetical protein